eukprot:TRINITY_DN20429_c0_g1_i1.p1 TRINITY_DN20429_c0_g1~~TRINITY_DN20429_c0_g1_i1.p1  ORF type:complete len:690 (+),score=308.63 TRINITY_DN20429_c0_g1_i1:73-2142(+)
MGVWSLLQYFRTYTPHAVQDIDLADWETVPAFDMVYVDVNSALHGADLSRLINVVSMLRPTKALVLAADEAASGAGGKPKPGKYLSAARYFLASAEYVRGSKHKVEEVLTDQEDYVSPFVLPQAEPMPTLKRAVTVDAPDCLLAVVARDMKGAADTKIAGAVRFCTQHGHGSNRHCIVSRDNDMLLAAMSAWSPAAPSAGKRKRDAPPAPPLPPYVLSWPGDNWLDTGLTLVDLSVALPALAGSAPTAGLPAATLSGVGRDFALLTLLSLGGDFCPGILGGAHYTHLHGLVERYGDVAKTAGGRLVGEDAHGLPKVHAARLVKFLRRAGVGRETAHADAATIPDATAAATAAKGWLRALWASMAALMSGRMVEAADTKHAAAPPTAGAVVGWIEDNLEAAQEALSGEAPAVKTVLEVFGTDKNSQHLYGQGELQDKAKLPPRNPLCEVLPPYLARPVEIYKVRLAADAVLPPLLSSSSTAALIQKRSKAPRSPGTATLPPTLRPRKGLFRGFGATLGRSSNARLAEDSGITISIVGEPEPAKGKKKKKAAAPAAPAAPDITSQMWGMLGMGSFVKEEDAPKAAAAAKKKKTSAHDKLLLKALLEERREKRAATKKRKREARAAEDDDDDAPSRKKQKLTPAQKAAQKAAQETAEKKAARKQKVRAVAQKKLKKKELPVKHPKKKKKSQA